MKRTTISLPEDLHAAIEREARRRGVSVSEITREALEARLGRTPGAKREVPFAALGRSGHRDTAARLDEILAESWTDDIDPRR